MGTGDFRLGTIRAEPTQCYWPVLLPETTKLNWFVVYWDASVTVYVADLCSSSKRVCTSSTQSSLVSGYWLILGAAHLVLLVVPT